MTKKLGFPRGERLKSKRQIDAIFARGQRFGVPPVRASFLFVPAEDVPVRVGVTVSKRFFKRAVDRNRVKRLLREAYRLQKTAINEAMVQRGQSLHLFLTYTENKLPEFAPIHASVGTIIGRLIKKAAQHENPA